MYHNVIGRAQGIGQRRFIRTVLVMSLMKECAKDGLDRSGCSF